MAQATYKRGLIIYATLPNNSGAAISVGDVLEDDASNGIKALTNGGNFLGVSHEDIADGDEGVVELPTLAVYEIDLATGFNPAQLDAVYAAGSGTFDDGSGHAAALAAGYIVDVDPASGSAIARTAMISEKLSPAAHG